MPKAGVLRQEKQQLCHRWVEARSHRRLQKGQQGCGQGKEQRSSVALALEPVGMGSVSPKAHTEPQQKGSRVAHLS